MNNDRPGIIPLGPINQNLLDELRHIALAASVYDWEWGHSGTETQEAALAYMAEMLAHSDRTDLNLVVYGDDGGIPFGVAITGNGPTSEANARFICAAQPVNVIRLLDEIARLRESSDVAAILAMSDEEILADARARGIDPEQNAIEMRALFERAKAQADALTSVSLPTCPCCGQPMPPFPPPPPPAANIAGEGKPSGWRERPSQI